MGKSQQSTTKRILKNGMTIQWRYQNERVYFDVSAPTEGWLTIGFNENKGIVGAYLLMANVIGERAQVVEHYTMDQGKYLPIESLGMEPQVLDVDGSQTSGKTKVKFSIPIQKNNKYQKDLTKGSQYTLILAYSRADDFQHHSMMRTHIPITL